MTKEQPPKINIWLERLISSFRKLYTSTELRKDYKLETEKNNSRMWEEFIAAKTLCEVADNNPFLQTSVWDLNLPEATKESLYKLYIDTAADLLQFGQKELEYYQNYLAYDSKQVKEYLIMNGFRPAYEGIGTYKLSYQKIIRGFVGSYVSDVSKIQKDIQLLSEFNLDRPSLNATWLEEYYKRYEYIEGEELLLTQLKHVKIEDNDEENELGPYQDFFTAVSCFWDAYNSYCTKYDIKKEMQAPIIPVEEKDLDWFTNDQLLSMKKDVVWATMSIFRRIGTFNYCSIAEFLEGKDEEKLNYTELETDDALQLVMVLFVEIKIDFESLLIDIKNQKKRDIDTEEQLSYRQVNPWLAEQIQEFRTLHTDGQLRAAYQKAIKERPQLLWSVFLGEEALIHAVKEKPILMTPVENLDIYDYIKDCLRDNNILRVCNIMQYTYMDFSNMPPLGDPGAHTIEEWLEEHGLHLSHSYNETFKVRLPK